MTSLPANVLTFVICASFLCVCSLRLTRTRSATASEGARGGGGEARGMESLSGLRPRVGRIASLGFSSSRRGRREAAGRKMKRRYRPVGVIFVTVASLPFPTQTLVPSKHIPNGVSTCRIGGPRTFPLLDANLHTALRP